MPPKRKAAAKKPTVLVQKKTTRNRRRNANRASPAPPSPPAPSPSAGSSALAPGSPALAPAAGAPGRSELTQSFVEELIANQLAPLLKQIGSNRLHLMELNMHHEINMAADASAPRILNANVLEGIRSTAMKQLLATVTRLFAAWRLYQEIQAPSHPMSSSSRQAFTEQQRASICDFIYRSVPGSPRVG